MGTTETKHHQKRSHPFRRYIATTGDNMRDEFHTITHGEINAGNVSGVNCAFSGSGK